jgi:multiple sugar transport system ATP-binding protein
MAQLAIRNVRKSFKNNVVLDGISLELERGEIVCVFGPSGAGKTVLLRLVAGVESPDFGSILLAGQDVTDAPPERRGVGMAFQNFALFPHMSAFDNVASALTARGAPPDLIKQRVEKIASLLKISHVLAHEPRELSNGQKQRTALARALVADPKILLLDDPLRNVDAKLRYEMRLELPPLLRNSGATALYVTQDYKEAMAIGDRIAVLIGGGFAQVAAPTEIYREPATLSVARLFGDPSINLVPVEPLIRPEGLTVHFAGCVLPISMDFESAAGRACMLGLRPEAIMVDDVPSPDAFPIDVAAVTPLNEKTLMLLRAHDGHELIASEAEIDEEPRRHGPAHARFDSNAVLLFDAESGKRIPRRTL